MMSVNITPDWNLSHMPDYATIRGADSGRKYEIGDMVREDLVVTRISRGAIIPAGAIAISVRLP